MLPNIRLSGASSSPIDSFLGVTAAAAVAAKTNSISVTPSSRTTTNTGGASSSGWGTTGKTLADYVKESAWQSSVSNNTNSMPWAAAVKSPPDSQQQQQQQQQQHNAASSFDYNSTIGSWNSPETSSSSRGGWNADGSSKTDGSLDDGTAIWGNPTSKKTGVDWTEKESSMIPQQSQQTSNNLEKRIQKPEPTISSLNGTEAWGASMRSSANSSSSSSSQQQTKNDNSGNTYVTTKPVDESLSWAESTSLQQATQQITRTDENSSPPNSNSVWNNLGINKQKSSDWLSSTSGSIGGNSSTHNANTSSRLDELNKQLESSNFFDSVSSSMTKYTSSSNNHNNLNQHEHQSISQGVSVGPVNGASVGTFGGNSMNDLKQMGANYSNNLLDSPNRQPSDLSATNSNQALDAAAYSSAAAPPRDLLKQMVHQIQLAVQAGHLNAHILNQPMSTPTLQLVYQLLQQIKMLHQLQEIQQRASIKSDLSTLSNMDLQINRTRQNISLLQKAITQQQAALTKNETSRDSNFKQQQQQAANNYSYATISKLSTNLKVPSNNMSNVISNSNLDNFRRSSLIDTLSNNSNSDSLRSAQATFDANATIDKTLSSLILASSSSSANNILGGDKSTTQSGDFSKAQGFSGSGDICQQQPGKGSLSARSSAWSAFSSNDFVSEQGWPGQSRISSNVSQDQHQYSAFDNAFDFTGKKNFDSTANTTSAPFSSARAGGLSLQSNPWMFNPNSPSLNMGGVMGKQQQATSSGGNAGGRPAPPPGLLSNFGPLIGGSSSAEGISILDSELDLNSSDDAQLQSRESSSSLWSGSWFD